MTLYRQLVIAVAVLFTLLYGINIAVGIYHARELVGEQMQVHARDTATSVALSMSQAAKQQDLATLDAMFNAVSDSGYFQEMSYQSLEGEVLIDRKFAVSVEGVPSWFIRQIPLPSPQAEAEITSGWMRLGKLIITSHPGQAYKKLWQTTRQQLITFALVTALVCLFAVFALRILLRPLSRVEAQANDICKQQFIVQHRVPRTRELRRVVEAMNRMSARLKSIFDKQLNQISYLQEQSLRDSLTGLSNRLDFDARMGSLLREEREPLSGALMILTVSNMREINNKAGREEGNKTLKALGEKIQGALNQFPQSIVARRQGPELTVFVPNIIAEEARNLAQQIFDVARQVEWCYQDEFTPCIYMGYTYAGKLTNVAEMLREADMALNKAVELRDSCWANLDDVERGQIVPVLSASMEEWRKILDQAIAEKSTVLHYQPIYSTSRTLVGYEAFARLPSGNELIDAGVFIPMAERFGLVAEFDKLTLSVLSRQFKSFPENCYICVNISVPSIQDAAFVSWLGQFLTDNKELAGRLVMELSEYAMQIDERYVREFSALLTAYNANLAIDHFGLESSAFGFLGNLPLHHIKIHHSFVQGLEENPGNHFYVQSLAQVARSLDLQLLAEGIEREQEWNALLELGIDAGQGYLLGKPAADLAAS